MQKSYTTETARKLVISERADQLSDELLKKYKTAPSEMTPEEFQTLSVFLQIYLAEQIKVHGADKGLLALAQLLLQSSPPEGDYPYAGTTQAKDEFREANGYSDWLNGRDPSDNERIYQQALGIIRTGNAQENMAAVGEPALYFLGGGLGATIRTVAAANGSFQLGIGAGQAAEGDYWNAAGNMLSGLLGVATLAVPGAKVPVLKDGGTKGAGGSITKISDEMKADPYHPDWQRYSGDIPKDLGSAFNSSATPGGKPLTSHAFESLSRHGFKDLQQVDSIINNATHKIMQRDGATVFVQKTGSGSKARYNLVVEGERGIVTGMRNFTKQEVKNMARNQGWEDFPF